MGMDYFTIRGLRPGRALDGHVHDLLGFPEPVWPYSTHPNAQGRLRDWLKAHNATVSLPGKEKVREDCAVFINGFSESYPAVSENHALCLAVLLSDYLIHNGRQVPVTGFR